MVPLFLHYRLVRALLVLMALLGSLWRGPASPAPIPSGDGAGMSVVPPPAPPAPLSSEPAGEREPGGELLPVIDGRLLLEDDIPRRWWKGPVHFEPQRHDGNPATASAPARSAELPPRHLSRIGQRFQLLDEHGVRCSARVVALEARTRFWFEEPEAVLESRGGPNGLARAMLRSDWGTPQLVATIEPESGSCAEARWAIPLGAPQPILRAVHRATPDVERAAYAAYRATREWKSLQAAEERSTPAGDKPRAWDDGKPLAAFEIVTPTRRLVYLRFWVPCASLHVLLEATDPAAPISAAGLRLRAFANRPGEGWPRGVVSDFSDYDWDPEGTIEGARPGMLGVWFQDSVYWIPPTGRIEQQEWGVGSDACPC